MHASAVAIGARALLILGASGSGKSGLALEMMARGALLVADDQVILTDTSRGIGVSAPDAIRGLIEARGVGLLNAQVATGTFLAAAVDLDQIETDRLPQRREIVLLDRAVPLLHKVDNVYFPASLVQYLRADRRT